MYLFGDIIIQLCARILSSAVIFILDFSFPPFKGFILGLQ